MPRATSKYRGPSARTPSGPRSPRGGGRRRELILFAVFGLVVVLGLASIGGAYLFYRNDHDWTAVASVNGHDISREELRARMNVLALLVNRRADYIATAGSAGRLTASEKTALSAQVNAVIADPVSVARESLIDDELLRQLAVRDGVATPPSPDRWVEAGRYASSDLAQEVRYVRFGLPAGSAGTTVAGSPATAPAGAWPAATAGNVAAATERLRTEIAANTPVNSIVAGLTGAGWTAIGEDVPISVSGAPADPSLELDTSIAVAALAGKTGDIVGPTADLYGRVAMGRILGVPDTSNLASRIAPYAAQTNVDSGALQSWADSEALRRAVTDHLLAGWRTGGVLQAHFRELVIGAAPSASSGTAGPWVELSGLAVDNLAGVDPASVAGAPAGLDLHLDALAVTLRDLAPADRSKLWAGLVAAANTKAGTGTGQSGEIGYVTKDGLVADVGKAAFADSVKTGDVLGPITTSGGPQLFFVESRYSGILDERAQAALVQIRTDPAANAATYTAKFSPADRALADDSGWRAQVEFATSEPANGALFETPIGAYSDPFVLDGRLALAVVDQRKTAAPDPRMADRLTLDGFDAWFANELAKATITRNPTPLPELVPSASPTSSAAAASERAPATPDLPTVPGLPPATPVPTDAFGLPALP